MRIKVQVAQHQARGKYFMKLKYKPDLIWWFEVNHPIRNCFSSK